MGMNPNFSPFLSFIAVHSSLYASPFSSLLPDHINSLCLSLLNIHSYYFSHAWHIFISFTSISLPLFQSRLSPSSSLLPILLSPFSLSRSVFRPLVFLPSQMSEHSLVFRLPCHHIFHTGPSLNWACIILSYHVEYLITARDERLPPPIPSWTDTHIKYSVDSHNTQPHRHKHIRRWSSGTGIHAEGCVCVHLYISCLHQVVDAIVTA